MALTMATAQITLDGTTWPEAVSEWHTADGMGDFRFEDNTGFGSWSVKPDRPDEFNYFSRGTVVGYRDMLKEFVKLPGTITNKSYLPAYCDGIYDYSNVILACRVGAGEVNMIKRTDSTTALLGLKSDEDGLYGIMIYMDPTPKDYERMVGVTAAKVAMIGLMSSPLPVPLK